MKQKLQIFVSSTYDDLIEERQAAVEAILKTGHIPAGMELFAADDKSQMEIIKDWISGSDIYMLILGARYGSIDKNSGKSYTELEYDFATQIKKPLFAIVMSEIWIKDKMEHIPKLANEIKQNRDKFDRFKKNVKSKMIKIVSNKDELQSSTMQSIYNLKGKYKFKGWIQYDEIEQNDKRIIDLEIENEKLKNQLINKTNVVIEKSVESKSISYLTKKYIREKNIMDFDELINNTTKIAINKIINSQYNFSETLSEELFLRRIKDYKKNIFELLKILAISCYWHDSFDYSTLFKQIQRVLSKTVIDIASTSNPFWDLRDYPGLLLFFTSGISLVAKDKYSQLKELFELRISRKHEIQEQLTEPLYELYPLRVMGDTFKKIQEDYNFNSFIIYEELKNIFINDVFHFEEDYSKSFNKFEYMYTLYYAETRYNTDYRFFFPIGKYKGSGWRGRLNYPEIASIIDNEIKKDKKNWLPIMNGLFKSESIIEIKKKVDESLFRDKTIW